MTASGAPAIETLGDPFVACVAVEVLRMNWTTASRNAVYETPPVSASIAHLLAGYSTITGAPCKVANSTPTARMPNFYPTTDISGGWDRLAPQTKSSLGQGGWVCNMSIGEIYSLSNYSVIHIIIESRCTCVHVYWQYIIHIHVCVTSPPCFKAQLTWRLLVSAVILSDSCRTDKGDEQKHNKKGPWGGHTMIGGSI